MVFKYRKRVLAFFVVSLCFLFQPSLSLSAPPAESVLVIYYSSGTQTCAGGAGGGTGTYPQDLMAAVTTALGPIASSITLDPVSGSGIGLTGTQLLQYCQVYDLRFENLCNNIWVAGATQSDMVTAADTTAYQTYLAGGGSLFLQGEHHDYYERNTALLQLINAVATTPIITTICTTSICSDIGQSGYETLTNPFSGNYGFNNNYNNLSAGTSFVGDYIGGIPSADYGSGLPLITIPDLSYSGGAGAVMLAWQGGALKSPYSAGKLVASFETNAFDSGDAGIPTWNTFARQALQNVYTTQSGCIHYTVDKTFNQASLCVGQTGSFYICAHNTSASAAATITNYSISDTLPTCISYTSYTASGGAPTHGNSGNLHWWTFPSIAPGASYCVTVNFTAVNTTCP